MQTPSPEDIAQRIIDGHPPLTGPMGVFDMAPGRYKRLAAALILYMRRNRRTLERIGRSPDVVGRTHRQLLDAFAKHREKAMQAARGEAPFRLNVIDTALGVIEFGAPKPSGSALLASMTREAAE